MRWYPSLMPTRVLWLPPAELTPSRYEISLVANGAETFLAAVPATPSGPHWDSLNRRHVYVDDVGTDASIYRVRALGPNRELYGDTGPFQPSTSVAANLASRKLVDHNYGGPDALTYQAANGVGIADAIIRFFRASNWDAGRREVGEYVVETDGLGRWKAPVWLEPGLDWVLTFEKRGEYGPDVRRITV